MTRKQKLGTGIYFSAEELYPALLLILCAFLKATAMTTLDAGASVLFLTEYLGQCIPQTLIATAVLAAVIWPALSVFKEKTPKLPVLLFFIAGGISFLFYAATFFAPSSTTSFSLVVWKEGFRVLTETAFWMTAFRFGVFKSDNKTLVAVLIAQTFGILVASGIVYLSAETPVHLILYASLLSVCSALALNVLVNNGSAPVLYRFAFDKQNAKKGKDSLQRNFTFCFYVSSAIFVFAVGIFQYYFLTSATEYTVGETTFLTRVYSAIFVSSALITSLSYYLFTKCRFSLLNSLYFLPVVLLLASVGGWFSLFAFIAGAQAFFGAICIAKEATLQTVPLAVSLRTGLRETIFRKSFIEPVALALSGCFLLFAKQSALQVEILHFISGLVIIVLLAVIALRSAYLKLILNMLKMHLWRGGKILLAGKEIERHLNENLNSLDSSNALYALRVVEESMTSSLLTCLRQALYHCNADVRLYALSKIETLKLSSVLFDVLELIKNDESIAVRQSAVRVMCRLGREEEREKAVELINDPDLREGALTGLLAVGREGVFVAIERISYLSVSENNNDRLLAATVLGNAGNEAFYHPLMCLMMDPDPEICKAALISAGKIRNRILLPVVMETFRFPELRETAVDTLLQFKERALPEIKEIILSDQHPIQFRILLTRLVARFNSTAAEEFLFNHIRIEDRRIRFNIIKALALSGYKATGKEINTVRLCLYDEMETATGILAAIYIFNKNKKEEINASLDILKTALNGEIEYTKERILLLLALLYPSDALTDFLSKYNPSEPQDDKTVKVVDKILSGELRMLCMPLFEDKTLQQRLALLRPQFYPPVLTVNGHIQDILETSAGELTDWTRACAAYTVGMAGDAQPVKALDALLSDPDAIIRETAVWALGKILPQEEASRLVFKNLEDSSPYVARMARFVADGMGHTVF